MKQLTIIGEDVDVYEPGVGHRPAVEWKTRLLEQKDARLWYRWHEWTNGGAYIAGTGISRWVRALIQDTHSPMGPVFEQWNVVY